MRVEVEFRNKKFIKFYNENEKIDFPHDLGNSKTHEEKQVFINGDYVSRDKLVQGNNSGASIHNSLPAEKLWFEKWWLKYLIFPIAVTIAGGLILYYVTPIGTRETPKITEQTPDEQLIKNARGLATEIFRYISERKASEPPYDYNNFQESGSRISRYYGESEDLFAIQFGPRLSEYREEFLNRGLKNESFERYYSHPTNFIGMEYVAAGLNELSAQLKARQTVIE